MFYDIFNTGYIGYLILAGDTEGLRFISFQKGKNPVNIQDHWKKKPEFFKGIKSQLRSYFKGERKQFDIPLALEGTPFQKKVWKALQAIPYGELVSYKDIAKAVDSPKAVRAVGRANGQNPIPVIIPCHRVIGSDGSLTGFGGGLETKKRLIDLERSRL